MEKLPHSEKLVQNTISNNLNTLYNSDVRVKTKTGYKKIHTVSQVIPLEVFEAIHGRIIQTSNRKNIVV
jgi:hypothetical protein